MDLNRIAALLEANSFGPAWNLLQNIPADATDAAVDALRLDCLMGMGQFEKAYDLAGEMVKGNRATAKAADLRAHLRPAMDGPPRLETVHGLRPFGSEIPRAVLSRIQWAVIHGYRYRGLQMVKDPFDLALYPMLVWNLKPLTIIEIGSKSGGSALWFGDMLHNFRIPGHVYSVDLLRVGDVAQDNVTFLEGDGRRLDGALAPSFLSDLPRPWLVIEDADHAPETTSAVLDFFHVHLHAGDYIVIEDGIISDLHPADYPDYSSGPHQALRRFLAAHESEYAIDAQYCDFFGYNATWNSNGYLKRIG